LLGSLSRRNVLVLAPQIFPFSFSKKLISSLWGEKEIRKRADQLRSEKEKSEDPFTKKLISPFQNKMEKLISSLLERGGRKEKKLISSVQALEKS